MSTLARRVGRRRGQRGNLIIETLVVVPLLIALCGIGFWFYQVHTAQMKAFQKVREPVVATATHGCGQGGDTNVSMPSGGGAQVSGGGAITVPGANFTQVYQSVPGGPNNGVITRSLGTAKSSTNDKLSGWRVTWFEPKDTSFAAQASMMCNEKVEDGQPKPMKVSAAGAFSL